MALKPVTGQAKVPAHLLVELVDAGNALANACENDDLAYAWERANAAVAADLDYAPHR